MRYRAWLFRILVALTAAASATACTQVIVGGGVYDDATRAGIGGAIVTFTSTSTGVTFNYTSGLPSGGYLIYLPEDTYIRQVVHATCNNVRPPSQDPLFEAFSPYTFNFFMSCP
jgi:hypothetical protein